MTARRREERLRDVPISAVALSNETLAQHNVVELADLTTFTPNFRQSQGVLGGYRIVRGISSASNFSFDQAVGAFLDGQNVGRNQLGRLPLFDVERVEVLRGPQVILFGNSTTGGAVSTTSKRPGTEFSADVRGTYEFNADDTVIEGGVTLPISDKLRFRVAGFSQTLDHGWTESVINGQSTHDPRFNTQAFRVIGVYEPTDNLTATLKYEKANVRIDGGLMQAIVNRLNLPGIADATFDDRRVIGSGAPLNSPPDYTYVDPELALANIEYRFGNFTLTSTTSYATFHFSQQLESDWTELPVANIFQSEYYRQFGQELRLAGNFGDRIDFQAGAYYQKDRKDHFRPVDINPPAAGTPLPPLGITVGMKGLSESWSVFADATFHLTSKLRLGLGARYSEYDRTTDQYNHATVVGTHERYPAMETTFVSPGVSIYSLVGGFAHDYYGIEDSESHFQPQVLLQYAFDDSVMAYAKYVKGAKAGGYDSSYQGDNPRGGIFLPEEATSYELGLKGVFLDRTVNASVSVFRTDFDNLQVSVFDGRAANIVGNAASQRSQGVEFEATWLPAPGWTVNANGAYLDSKFIEYKGAGCNYVQRAATPAGVRCLSDLSGTRNPYQPEWSGTLSVAYEAEVGSYTLTPKLDLSYKSEYQTSSALDPAGLVPAFTLVDARVEWTQPGAPWSVALFGKNLTDERYMEFFLDALLLPGVSGASMNRGRQLGVQVSAKF